MADKERAIVMLALMLAKNNKYNHSDSDIAGHAIMLCQCARGIARRKEKRAELRLSQGMLARYGREDLDARHTINLIASYYNASLHEPEGTTEFRLIWTAGVWCGIYHK